MWVARWARTSEKKPREKYLQARATAVIRRGDRTSNTEPKRPEGCQKIASERASVLAANWLLQAWLLADEAFESSYSIGEPGKSGTHDENPSSPAGYWYRTRSRRQYGRPGVLVLSSSRNSLSALTANDQLFREANKSCAAADIDSGMHRWHPSCWALARTMCKFQIRGG